MTSAFAFLNAVTTLIMFVFLWYFPKSFKPVLILIVAVSLGIFLLGVLISWVRGN